MQHDEFDGSTTADLVEVYHLGDTVRRTVLCRWDYREGFTYADARSIFLRRGDWRGVELRVASIQVRNASFLGFDDVAAFHRVIMDFIRLSRGKITSKPLLS